MKGEKYVFEMVDTYTTVFILSGKVSISCNGFSNLLFHEDQIVLWPMSLNCAWESQTDAAVIVLFGDSEMLPCYKKSFSDQLDLQLDTEFEFKGLPIKPRLRDFLSTVKNYLDDGMSCPNMHKIKQRELSMIFRAYYSP